jgi:hypothetical protein
MKILSFFIAFCVALCTGSLFPVQAFAEEISFSQVLSVLPDKKKVESVSTLWVEHPAFGFFSALTMQDAEAALKVNIGSWFTVSAGNLKKNGALSRIASPLTSKYTSALGQPSLPPTQVASTVPHSAGNHPIAGAVYFVIPVLSGISIDLYLNAETTGGVSVSLPIKLPVGKTTIRFTESVYTYVLNSRAITAWYTDELQFASGHYITILTEATARSRFLGNLLTCYGVFGFSESPIGGFTPWFRFETGFAARYWIIKGRVFYAPNDFYTSDSRVIAGRIRYAVNPFTQFPLSKKYGVFNGVGITFAGDSSTSLFSARIAERVSAGFFAVTFTAGLDNFLFDGGKINAGKETSFPLQLTGSFMFPGVKTSLTAHRKWYCDADWNEKKTEYAVSLVLTPKLSSGDIPFPPEIIPALSCKVTVTTYPDGRVKGATKASLKWKMKAQTLKVAATVNLEMPFEK